MAASSRERILDAAERLIAERGADVPFREIAAGAGQKNNSAVHYHFGSREGLIRAVIARRVQVEDRRRLEMIAALEEDETGDDLRSLVGAITRPLSESAYAEGATHYARFLEQVRHHPAFSETVFELANYPAAQILVNRIVRHLTHLPTHVRDRRLLTIMTVSFALLADFERRADGKGQGPVMPPDELVEDIVSMIVGLLTAPVLERAAS
jgi:AcrR family transcriptional regulator